mmetsp:Transcript_21992/g.61638  ORF Transcript_21992/g.61638 Transcript_21992/m.61638 type:complete len:230 (-) Transcript_21992:19-708(-)
MLPPAPPVSPMYAGHSAHQRDLQGGRCLGVRPARRPRTVACCHTARARLGGRPAEARRPAGAADRLRRARPRGIRAQALRPEHRPPALRAVQVAPAGLPPRHGVDGDPPAGRGLRGGRARRRAGPRLAPPAREVRHHPGELGGRGPEHHQGARLRLLQRGDGQRLAPGLGHARRHDGGAGLAQRARRAVLPRAMLHQGRDHRQRGHAQHRPRRVSGQRRRGGRRQGRCP